MQAFRDCLRSCDLEDLGFVGDKFTWSRGAIRLDRAVCNPAWLDLFPHAGVRNGEHCRSDHRPVLLDTEFHEANLLQPVEGFKHFEARWLMEETVDAVVQGAWDRAKLCGQSPTLADRTKAVHAELHVWDREVLKAPKKRLKNLKKQLENVRHQERSPDVIWKQKELQLKIDLLMEQEEMYWLQRGRTNWLLQGDRNTQFFHNAATSRKRRNQIKRILDDDGNWHEGTANVVPVVKSYFDHLFTSHVNDPGEDVLNKVERKVTPEMNAGLLAPFTAEEVARPFLQ